MKDRRLPAFYGSQDKVEEIMKGFEEAMKVSFKPTFSDEFFLKHTKALIKNGNKFSKRNSRPW